MVEGMGFSIRIIKRTVSVFGVSLLFASAVHAQPAEDIPLGSDIGIIDQIVTSSFEPASLIILQEVDEGEVYQYRAIAVPLPQENEDVDTAIKKRIVGAAVPLESDSESDRFHFTFFMASADSAFAATEVKQWSQLALGQNSPTYAQLETKMAELKHRLKIKRVTAIDLEEKLEALRTKASSIAEVDAIIKLKMELASLKGVSEEKDEEIARLKSLTEQGRDISEPENISRMRSELAENLREAAKITSMADRLNTRKREAAMQRFRAKINLVKEMQNTDPERLAQEVISLRKTRQDFERRLGVSSSDQGSDEF